jgi:hypothetical protein
LGFVKKETITPNAAGDVQIKTEPAPNGVFADCHGCNNEKSRCIHYVE